MKNIEHYNLEQLEFDVLEVETPYEYYGETIHGVLEIYYRTKHSADGIKLISIPVPQTNMGFIKGVCYFWLISDYIDYDYGTRKPKLHNRKVEKELVDLNDYVDDFFKMFDEIMK